MIQKNLSKNLRYLRKKFKLSQAAFGEIFEMNRGNIQSYEKGSAPEPYKLLEIARYFKLTLEQLLIIDLSSYYDKIIDGSISNTEDKLIIFNKASESQEEYSIQSSNQSDCLEKLSAKDDIIASKKDQIKALERIIVSKEELIELLKKDR